MRKIISLVLTLSLVAGLSLSLTACGEPKDDGPEIKVYLGEEVYDFDPTDYYVSDNAAKVMSLLYDPLFTLNERGKLKKDGAAKKYKVDEDERTIVIELRESYWSNGDRVKAEDFIYAWRDILINPNTANPAAALLYDIENAVEVKNGESIYKFGAVASGVYEITITYREGADYKQLLKNLASVATAPILRSATNGADGYWSKNVATAITNGPFMISNMDYDNNSFTVVRNEGYHQSLDVKNYTKIVNPGKLVSFTTLGEGEEMLTYSDIENKTVFFMGDASLEDRAANKKKAEVADSLSTYTYVFNLENPLFAIEEVRQALSMVIDRNSIIEAITFGKAATGLLPDTVLNSKGKTFSDDIISTSAKEDEARALISSASSKLAGLDKKITLTVNNDIESVAIANIVKTAWEKLGFTVEINAVGKVVTTDVPEKDSKFYDSEIQLLVKEASRGECSFDVIAVDWQMFSTDPFVALAAFANHYSGCGVELPEGVIYYGSFGGYSSAEYDALIESAYKASGKDREGYLKDAERMLVESAAIVPLVFNQNFAFVSRDLSKLDFDGFGNFVFTDVKQKNYRKYLD